MSRVHSKETVVIVDGNDISSYCTDSSRNRSSGTEDNTRYGLDDIVKDPTLRSGEFGCGGKYDSDVTDGPRAVLDPLVGTVVRILYRPEGTGTGLPQDSFDTVITGYAESAPVAGYRTWTLTTEPTGPWNTDPQ